MAGRDRIYRTIVSILAARRYVAVLLAVFFIWPIWASGQSSFKITSFGTDAGGTLSPSAAISNSISSQYHFFGRHHIVHRYTGEVNLGLVFLSNPLQRSRLFSLDYRVLYPLKYLFSHRVTGLNDRFNPYIYAGLGIVRYQRLNVKVQNDPLLRESEGAISNTSIWNNGNGWTFQVPLGVGTDYQLDDYASLRITGGYYLLGSQSVIGNTGTVDGFFGATVGLKFNPFGSDRDNDHIPTIREINDTRTYPDNPDSDGDGLLDGDEVFRYKTNPLKRDSDGDGLADGDEVLIYKTNPLLLDTDGGLIDDGAEVRQHSNPHDWADDHPIKSNQVKVVKWLPAYPVAAYRTYKPFYYNTLEYQLGDESKQTLRNIATLLQADSTLGIKVLGFADKRGDGTMNRALSNVRSWFVGKYFLEKGISASRIAMIGYGEDRPIQAPASKLLDENRRTELQLSYDLLKKKTADYKTFPAIQLPSEAPYLIPPAAIQFDPYSDQLSEKATRWLSALVQFLKEHEEYEVLISGVADHRGSAVVNNMLREARAASVTQFLLNNGISFKRLRIVHQEGSNPEGGRGVLVRGKKRSAQEK